MSSIDDLRETMARLRGPGGCPWDVEQTHKSICDCLVEEVAELLDTIDRDDFPHMREELGDLLLHVVSTRRWRPRPPISISTKLPRKLTTNSSA